MCVLPESRAALTLPPVSSGERKGKLIPSGESERDAKFQAPPNGATQQKGSKRGQEYTTRPRKTRERAHTRRKILDYDGERQSRGFLILNL